MMLLLIPVLIALDAYTKHLAENGLKEHGITLIEGFFKLTYVENRGAAFGTMQGARWLLVVFTALVLIAGGIYYVKQCKIKGTAASRLAMVLIASGAIGNLIDRFLRGYVVDMLDFYIFGYNFPVFNVADICVVVGVGLFILATFLEERKNEKAKRG